MKKLIAKKDNFIQDFQDSLGNTSIKKIAVPGGGTIYAKCEWENPTGSIKDRAAFAMLQEVLEKNENKEELHILEYSGGNLGISLAYQCFELGIKLDLVMSQSTSQSIIDKLESYGATLHFVDKQKGFYGVIEEAIRLSQNDKYTFLYQHQNRTNINTHFNKTGKEIIKQLEHTKIDAWVAAAGTGGSLLGVYKALKKQNDSVELHLVMPEEAPYGSTEPPNSFKKLAGTGGFGLGRKQAFIMEYENDIKQQWLCSYSEALKEMKKFYDETGIKIGTSAAANLKAAKEISCKLGENSTVVTIFPDQGSEEEWNLAFQ
ncbi:pyridoxal-phosphate dependent enzyme [Cytobacillus firmus]|uniref:PLP-dependent cysteine synthase family protein n=1 Tax=Cytobacillus firmus TaxID=1399 RepID=UPI00203D4B8F|nr:pyridoxal-phosphate dependent enzyme [Cytobacillus firmus]MCM3707370.1 pyridoxal-phosphate dependent enzyme [Cytobacillus firmus]